MQDDAEKHINLLNEFQGKSRIKMMIGIDGEWGLFQRFPAAHIVTGKQIGRAHV